MLSKSCNSDEVSTVISQPSSPIPSSNPTQTISSFHIFNPHPFLNHSFPLVLPLLPQEKSFHHLFCTSPSPPNHRRWYYYGNFTLKCTDLRFQFTLSHIYIYLFLWCSSMIVARIWRMKWRTSSAKSNMMIAWKQETPCKQLIFFHLICIIPYTFQFNIFLNFF